MEYCLKVRLGSLSFLSLIFSSATEGLNLSLHVSLNVLLHFPSLCVLASWPLSLSLSFTSFPTSMLQSQLSLFCMEETNIFKSPFNAPLCSFFFLLCLCWEWLERRRHCIQSPLCMYLYLSISDPFPACLRGSSTIVNTRTLTRR